MPAHRATSKPAAQLRTRQIYRKTIKLYLHSPIFIFFCHLIAFLLPSDVPDMTCTLCYCNFFSYHSLTVFRSGPLTLPKMKLLQLLLPLQMQQGEFMLQELVRRTHAIAVSQSVNINTKTEFTPEAYSTHIFLPKATLGSVSLLRGRPSITLLCQVLAQECILKIWEIFDLYFLWGCSL